MTDSDSPTGIRGAARFELLLGACVVLSLSGCFDPQAMVPAETDADTTGAETMDGSSTAAGASMSTISTTATTDDETNSGTGADETTTGTDTSGHCEVGVFGAAVFGSACFGE